MNNFQRWENYGQVDSPELPETPEIIKKNRKFHKNDQILNQTKRNINSVCFGKISVKKRLE